MQTLQYSAVQGLAEFLQNWRDWSWVACLVGGYISMCEYKYESTKIFSENMLTVFLPKCQQICDLYYCIKQIGLRLCWQWEIIYILYIKNGPVHRSFDAVQLSYPLSKKTPSKHNVSTCMFDGGDGVLRVIGSIPPPPNTASWVDAKELNFGLIWPHHFHAVLLWIIGKLQTGMYMYFLEQEDLAGAAGFQSFTA